MFRRFLYWLRGGSKPSVKVPVVETPAPVAVGSVLPQPANDNLQMLHDDDDPAVELEVVRYYLRDMRRENTVQGRLLTCPRERREYEACRAFEQALIWKYFRRH